MEQSKQPIHKNPNRIAWVVALVGCLLANATQAQFTYTTNAPDTNTITITRYTGPGGAVAIPSNINGRVVSDIGSWAFEYTRLSSVVIPNSVTNMGTRAFYRCTNLAAVTFGGGLIGIGESAFESCSELRNMDVPDSVTSILGSAFRQCSGLTNIAFGRGITSIGRWCSECTGLTEVMIGDGVTNIASYAFSGCSSLTNITFGISLSYVASSAFDGCTGITHIAILSSNILEGMIVNPSRLASITLGESVTNIPDFIFWHCSALTNMVIPDSVLNIGQQAFCDCTNLVGVTIGSGVTAVGLGAFSDCSALTSIVIPNNVTAIGEKPFAWCTSLTNVVIGNNATSIPHSMFYGCTNLLQLVAGSGITNIEPYAFAGCWGLNTVLFNGDAPPCASSLASSQAIVYYRAGTAGWTNTYAGRPTALWAPVPQPADFGPGPDGFGMNTTWVAGQTAVMEACEDLSAPNWVPVATNMFSAASSRYTDPGWTNHPHRYYRFRMP